MLKDFDLPALNKQNIYGFETALGLSIQGLNLGEIKINLLPLDYVKERQVSRQKILVCVITMAIFLSFFTQSIKDYIIWQPLSNGVDTVTETLNEVKKLERVYKGIEKKVKVEEDNLHMWKSIGAQGRFWVEAVSKTIDSIPENVYLVSIESLWGIPHSDKKERVSSKGFFEKKEESTSNNDIDTSKEVLIISIRGESYASKVSYIEEKVKKPIEELTLSDQKLPAFIDVRLVQGSVQHVRDTDKKHISENTADGIKSQPISFEIQCIVNPLSF
jgi:hypothetical protein